METIQVVLDRGLLRAVNHAARRARVNRSVLIRRALRQHLRRAQAQALEERDRRGYRENPDGEGLLMWEQVAAWPER